MGRPPRPTRWRRTGERVGEKEEDGAARERGGKAGGGGGEEEERRNKSSHVIAPRERDWRKFMFARCEL